MGKGNYLKDVRICLVGRFKHTHTDIKKWIEAGGGTVQTTVGKDTTHVVVSSDAWKKKISPESKDAKFGHVHIISYDWLENSMHASAKRAEKQYLWQTLEAKQHKKESLKLKGTATKAKLAEKAAQKAATDVSYRTAFIEHIKTFGGYDESDKTRSAKELHAEKSHIYTDEHGVHFDVDINTKSAKPMNISIHESAANPPTYATYIKQSGGKTNAVAIGASFPTAFRSFRKAFQQYTGVEWDRRAEAEDRYKMKSAPKAAAIEVIEID